MLAYRYILSLRYNNGCIYILSEINNLIYANGYDIMVKQLHNSLIYDRIIFKYMVKSERITFVC